LERRLFFKSVNPECIYEGNRYLASLESVHEGYSHAPCRLGLFRIVCQLPWRQEPPNNKIGISLRGSPTIKVFLDFGVELLLIIFLDIIETCRIKISTTNILSGEDVLI